MPWFWPKTIIFLFSKIHIFGCLKGFWRSNYNSKTSFKVCCKLTQWEIHHRFRKLHRWFVCSSNIRPTISSTIDCNQQNNDWQTYQQTKLTDSEDGEHSKLSRECGVVWPCEACTVLYCTILYCTVLSIYLSVETVSKLSQEDRVVWPCEASLSPRFSRLPPTEAGTQGSCSWVTLAQATS